MARAESRVLAIVESVVPLAALADSERMVLAHVSDDQARNFVRAVYHEFKNNPLASAHLRALIERASASEYSLGEWIEQLVVAYRWLDERARRARFVDIVDYISCAMDGSMRQAGHDVAWYLEQYGFERSIECGV